VSRILWTVQVLLAGLFLWAGGIKLALPLEPLAGPVPVPGPFLRLIGVAEVLGALGLVLPGLVGVRPALAPLAAAGLVVIMAGAAALGLLARDLVMTVVPLAVGLLATFVAYGRWRVVPHRRRRDRAPAG
jgi:hypothetical protein